MASATRSVIRAPSRSTLLSPSVAACCSTPAVARSWCAPKRESADRISVALSAAMALPPDLHVHTEFSWDAPHGSMEKSCERALELGLPAIAFTEHADWALVHEGQHTVDIHGYLDAVERCRSRFRDLRILTGVELGEPHWYPKETAAVLAAAPLDRVLGSIHCIRL